MLALTSITEFIIKILGAISKDFYLSAVGNLVVSP